VSYEAENSSVFRCTLKVVMVKELLLTGYRVSDSWCQTRHLTEQKFPKCSWKNPNWHNWKTPREFKPSPRLIIHADVSG